jgi:hypothetical protein
VEQEIRKQYNNVTHCFTNTWSLSLKELLKKAKIVPLHAMKALGGEEV